MNTKHIGMTIDFEASAIHLYNCLPEVPSTHKISSVNTKLQEMVNNKERYIDAMHFKTNTGSGSASVNLYLAQLNKRAKKYWKMRGVEEIVSQRVTENI